MIFKINILIDIMSYNLSNSQNQTIDLLSTPFTKELCPKQSCKLGSSYHLDEYRNTIPISYEDYEKLAKKLWGKDINVDNKKIKNIKNAFKFYKVAKTVNNPYEFVGAPYNKDGRNQKYISARNPASRSYFKLWEMLKDPVLNANNPILSQNDTVVSAHIADGPGGFVQAVKDYNPDAKLYGITLNDEWDSNVYSMFENSMDGGDITKRENIDNFIKNFDNNKADLVTGDGNINIMGFPIGDILEYRKKNSEYYREYDYIPTRKIENLDKMINILYNNEEIYNIHLILAQMVIAVNIQKIGGSFILKIKDLYTMQSAEILYFISSLYDNVELYKPKTSRVNNSEKYLIATGFKGINNNVSTQLLDFMSKLENLYKNGKYLHKILSNNVPRDFIEKLRNHNVDYAQKQIEFIQKTFNTCTKNHVTYNVDYPLMNRNIFSKDAYRLINNAIQFIKEYEVPGDINDDIPVFMEKDNKYKKKIDSEDYTGYEEVPYGKKGD